MHWCAYNAACHFKIVTPEKFVSRGNAFVTFGQCMNFMMQFQCVMPQLAADIPKNELVCVDMQIRQCTAVQTLHIAQKCRLNANRNHKIKKIVCNFTSHAIQHTEILRIGIFHDNSFDLAAQNSNQIRLLGFLFSLEFFQVY